jgi:hypothetical protein
MNTKPPLTLRFAIWCNRWTTSQLVFVVVIALLLIGTNVLAVYRLDEAKEIIDRFLAANASFK